MISKRSACEAASPGNAPAVVSPADDAASFLANPAFAATANAAAAPPGYFLVEGFQNLPAGASDPSYLTYVSSPLDGYDPAQCAALCSGGTIPGCNSFNICKSSPLLMRFGESILTNCRL